MRQLHTHEVNPANATLKIHVLDEPGPGGANHRYEVSGFTGNNPSAPASELEGSYMTVLFQNGPIAEAGVNGTTHEVLLAILEDRLVGFQSGPYANEMNATALAHIRAAQACLQARTRERLARGVEGTHQV